MCCQLFRQIISCLLFVAINSCFMSIIRDGNSYMSILQSTQLTGLWLLSTGDVIINTGLYEAASLFLTHSLISIPQKVFIILLFFLNFSNEFRIFQERQANSYNGHGQLLFGQFSPENFMKMKEIERREGECSQAGWVHVNWPGPGSTDLCSFLPVQVPGPAPGLVQVEPYPLN